jgi:hypothetical protein
MHTKSLAGGSENKNVTSNIKAWMNVLALTRI